MTTLGKLLTLLNVAVSLTFLAWATGLYANQIFWHTPQNQEGEKVFGLVEQLDKKLNDFKPVVQSAEARYDAAAGDVAKLEAERPVYLQDYADRLRSLRTGDVPDITPPVQPLVFRGTELDFKRTGQQGLDTGDGQIAKSKAGYEQAITQAIKDLVAEKVKLQTLIDEGRNLTVSITGTNPNKAEAVSPAERGLRVRWEDAKTLVRQYQLEQQFLRSPLTTVTLDNDTLKRRNRQLQARLDELNNTSPSTR